MICSFAVPHHLSLLPSATERCVTYYNGYSLKHLFLIGDNRGSLGLIKTVADRLNSTSLLMHDDLSHRRTSLVDDKNVQEITVAKLDILQPHLHEPVIDAFGVFLSASDENGDW